MTVTMLDDLEIQDSILVYKPTKWFRFDSHDEITAYDLAMILETVEFKVDEEMYNKLPKWVRVWFREEKDNGESD